MIGLASTRTPLALHRFAGRADRRLRAIELVRGSWGLALLLAPRRVLGPSHLDTNDDRAVGVARVLGARHLLQAVLSGLRPSPEVLAAGVWVDEVHALTAATLAVLDRRRRRGTLVDAGVAAAWAVFGRHDLSTGRTPPPRHGRHRDQMAAVLLPRLPGGGSLLETAHAARHRHHTQPVDDPPTHRTPHTSGRETSMTDTVADVLLARLRDWDVEQVFGYPGDGINGLLAAWGRAEDDPQFVQARHEEMAAFEAVGFAKFSGGFGVCVATSGPGAVHLLNGLYDAKLDHVPVVAIVGQTERSADGRAPISRRSTC